MYSEKKEEKELSIGQNRQSMALYVAGIYSMMKGYQPQTVIKCAALFRTYAPPPSPPRQRRRVDSWETTSLRCMSVG